MEKNTLIGSDGPRLIGDWMDAGLSSGFHLTSGRSVAWDVAADFPKLVTTQDISGFFKILQK